MAHSSRPRARILALALLGFSAIPAIHVHAAAPAAAQASLFKFQDTWVRVPPTGGRTGAAYMRIENTGDRQDRLTGGSSPDATTVQVHEMTMKNGVMDMRELAGGLAVPAHGAVTLAPGGYHIMLIGLTRPIKAGDDVPITLHFADAGDVTLHIPAKDAPSQDSGTGGMKAMTGMKGMSGMDHPQ